MKSLMARSTRRLVIRPSPSPLDEFLAIVTDHARRRKRSGTHTRRRLRSGPVSWQSSASRPRSLLQASEARFAASPPRTSAEARYEQPAAANVSRLLRSGQRMAQAADVLGVKHPRDTPDRSLESEAGMDVPEGIPAISPSKTAGRATTWTVTAQHVSAVLAASKRTMADRPSAGGGTPGRPQPSDEHGSTKPDRSSGGGAAQQNGDVRSPPSAESVRSPLVDARVGNRQRQGSAVSLDEGPTTAAQRKPSVRALSAGCPASGTMDRRCRGHAGCDKAADERPDA